MPENDDGESTVEVAEAKISGSVSAVRKALDKGEPQGDGANNDSDEDIPKGFAYHYSKLSDKDEDAVVYISYLGPTTFQGYSVKPGPRGKMAIFHMPYQQLENEIKMTNGGGRYDLLIQSGGRSITRKHIEIEGPPAEKFLEKPALPDDVESDAEIREIKKRAARADAELIAKRKEKALQDAMSDDGAGLPSDSLFQAVQGLNERVEQMAARPSGLEAMLPTIMPFLQNWFTQQRDDREKAEKEAERRHDKEMKEAQIRAEADKAARDQQFQLQMAAIKQQNENKTSPIENLKTTLGLIETIRDMALPAREKGEDDEGFMAKLGEVAKPLIAGLMGKAAQAASAAAPQSQAPQQVAGNLSAGQPAQPAPVSAPQGGSEVRENVAERIASQIVNTGILRLIDEMNVRADAGIGRVVEIIMNEFPGDLVDALGEAKSMDSLPVLLAPYRVPIEHLLTIKEAADKNPKTKAWLMDFWTELQGAINDPGEEAPLEEEAEEPAEETPANAESKNAGE